LLVRLQNLCGSSKSAHQATSAPYIRYKVYGGVLDPPTEGDTSRFGYYLLQVTKQYPKPHVYLQQHHSERAIWALWTLTGPIQCCPCRCLWSLDKKGGTAEIKHRIILLVLHNNGTILTCFVQKQQNILQQLQPRRGPNRL
jgi:hypothetical protein